MHQQLHNGRCLYFVSFSFKLAQVPAVHAAFDMG